MAKVRVAFASKNFQSSQQVRFKVYNQNGNLIYNILGNEWANTGVYYIEENFQFSSGNKSYLIIAEEVNGTWKASKLIKSSDTL